MRRRQTSVPSERAATVRALILAAVLLSIFLTITGILVTAAINIPTATDRSDEVEAMLLERDDSPQLLAGFVLQYDGPFTDTIRETSGGLAETISAQTLVGAHSRAFVRMDRRQGAIIELLVATSESAGRTFVTPAGPVAPEDVDGPDGMDLRVISRDEDWASHQAVVADQFLVMRITTFSSGPTAVDDDLELIASLATAQVDQWQQPKGIQLIESYSFARLGVRMLLAELSLAFSVLFGFGAVTMFTDRASRQRLSAWASGSRRRRHQVVNNNVVDITAQVRPLLRNYRLNGVLGVLTLLVVIASAYVIGIDLWPAGVPVLLLAAWLLDRAQRWTGIRPRQDLTLVPTLHGWRLVPGVALVLLTLSILTIGMMAFFASIAAQELGALGNDENLVDALIPLARILGIAMIVLSPAPLALSRRLAMASLATKVRADTRQKTLLLRAFADDSLRMRSRSVGSVSFIDRLSFRKWERFEEVVSRAVGAIGPVFALKEPNTRMPPLGAVREAVTDDAWHGRIIEMMESARLIVVFVARTQHCAVEFRDLRDRGLLHRTIFLIPPVDDAERRRRLHVLAEQVGFSPVLVDWEEPGRCVLAVIVHPVRGPIAITSEALDDIGYQVAIATASELLDEPYDLDAFASPPVLRELRPVDWGSKSRLWAPGTAPKRKRWFVRPWGIACAVLVVATITQALQIALPAQPDPYLLMRSENSVRELVRDAGTNEVFAITFSDELLQLPIIEGALQTGGGVDTEVVGQLPGPALRAAAAEGWVVGINQFERTVVALERATGSTWMLETNEGASGVEIVGDSAVVAFPAADALHVYDLRTGRLEQIVPVPGAPWDLELVSVGLVVTQATADGLLVLDPSTFAVEREWATPAGPKEIGAHGDDVWIQMGEGGTIGIVELDRQWIQTILEVDYVYPFGPGSGGAALTFEADRDPFQILIGSPGGRQTCTITLAAQPGTYLVDGSGNVFVALSGYTGVLAFPSCL
jgi:hypothetical protein